MQKHRETDFAKKRILCVGTCGLDFLHIVGEYLEEDKKADCSGGFIQRGGSASNCCTVLRQLGADCEFLGVLSSAIAFKCLIDDFRKRGILTDRCPFTETYPPFSSVILSKKDNKKTVVTTNKDFPILKREHFKNIDMRNYRWIHFEARNPGETLQMLLDVRSFNAETKDKITVSVALEQPAKENLVLAAKADFIFLSKAMALHMGLENKRDAVYGLRAHLQSAGFVSERWPTEEQTNNKPAIICSWDRQGFTCLDGEDNFLDLDAFPRSEIVDTRGISDTFYAGTIYCLSLWTTSLEDAVQFGNSLSAYKTAYRGYDAIGRFPRFSMEEE